MDAIEFSRAQLRPVNEADRQLVVRSLLPSQMPDMPELKALSFLVREIFDIATCSVSIIDEDWQRIAASSGLPTSDCARDESICTRVVYKNAPFIVEDLRKHPELSKMPYVTGEPGYRFYAGAPLQLDPGISIGALCVIDTKPRRLEKSQLEQLRHFATVATGLIKLHRANVMLQYDEAALKLAAMTDPLTGLYNRGALRDLIDRALDTAISSGGTLGAIYIDMDKFKSVNDTHGHIVGDMMLKEASDRIRSVLRASDYPLRMGGDEFAVLFNAPMTREALESVAVRLLDVFRKPFELNGLQLQTHASIGIALAPQDGNTWEELERNVDKALYAAKAAGRDRFVFFDTLGPNKIH
ncbi:sensor domain-containing diguanylate cyclase [Tianweitania sp. Rool2]|uniref:Sensor domain-containing diguanylate cyclase n=2 Tax=Oryzicola mucosus TaxID=2767425 RepID=A0A8J6TZY6_9HYPH|nr:sensor domain-containing diguanylate cyclase [Oryzicola mucosus]